MARWSSGDSADLAACVESGLDWRSIAKKFGRSVDSCRVRARAMGLKKTPCFRTPGGYSLPPSSQPTLAERLEANSIPEPNSGCVLWMGSGRPFGHGCLSVNGKSVAAHRVAWELANKCTVPAGMVVCHTCDVPACINPAHLWLGTVAENNADMRKKGRDKAKRVLTAEIVRSIRESTAPYREMAAAYGITKATVSDIRLGKTWRHLDGGSCTAQPPAAADPLDYGGDAWPEPEVPRDDEYDPGPMPDFLRRAKA